MAVTCYCSAEDYSEKQRRAVQRIFDSLAKGELRLLEHYRQVRSYPRQQCHKFLHIRVFYTPESYSEFNVYMRDVSASGTSFIYPGELHTQNILVGIPLPDRETTWFRGEIVRCKQIIDEDFWDYGVKFKDRLI